MEYTLQFNDGRSVSWRDFFSSKDYSKVYSKVFDLVTSHYEMAAVRIVSHRGTTIHEVVYYQDVKQK